MTCDPATLIQEAKCYKCIPPRIQAAVQTYQFASLAGGTMDPNQLVQEAKDFIGKIPPGLQMAVQIKLLCDILDDLD